MLYNLKNNSPFPDQTIPDCTISHLEINKKTPSMTGALHSLLLNSHGAVRISHLKHT